MSRETTREKERVPKLDTPLPKPIRLYTKLSYLLPVDCRERRSLILRGGVQLREVFILHVCTCPTQTSSCRARLLDARSRYCQMTCLARQAAAEYYARWWWTLEGERVSRLSTPEHRSRARANERKLAASEMVLQPTTSLHSDHHLTDPSVLAPICEVLYTYSGGI